jgi:geranylgeranyl diphosphate synthase, type II
VEAYLSECRQLTLHEIRDLVPRDGRYRSILYDLMLDYPLREAKALRPALCVATCRALGGSLEAVLRSAAIVELYHNAFLIHDDVEDGSESRRERPTLHWLHGAPIAVNVGDAMLALALEPLLDNMRLLGMGKALRIMQTIARMARESTEGQAIELHWIRSNEWRLTDADYLRMVYKKTSWYTFIAPMLIGGTVAGAAPERVTVLRKFAALLGIAFQIQDDILNLVAEGSAYGKEIAGDLWEGKHTLILMHALRAAGPCDRARAMEILRKPRAQRAQPAAGGQSDPSAPSPLPALLAALERRGELSAGARAQIEGALRPWQDACTAAVKSVEDVQFLITLVAQAGSIAYARTVARRFAHRAAALLERANWLAPSVHRSFLDGLVHFVVSRGR